MRTNAARALGRIGKVRRKHLFVAVKDLLRCLRYDKCDDARKNAAYALGQLKPFPGDDVETALETAALEDRTPSVRIESLHALQFFYRPESTLPTLLVTVCTDDNVPSVRQVAAKILKRLAEDNFAGAFPSMLETFIQAFDGIPQRASKAETANQKAQLHPLTLKDHFSHVSLGRALGLFRVFQEMGVIIRDKGRPLGYGTLSTELKQKQTLGILESNLHVSPRTLDKFVEEIESLFAEATGHVPRPPFVTTVLQGKRQVTQWTPAGWKAWEFIGHLLNDFDKPTSASTNGDTDE